MQDQQVASSRLVMALSECGKALGQVHPGLQQCPIELVGWDEHQQRMVRFSLGLLARKTSLEARHVSQVLELQ